MFPDHIVQSRIFTGSAQPEVRHEIRYTLTQICGMIRETQEQRKDV